MRQTVVIITVMLFFIGSSNIVVTGSSPSPGTFENFLPVQTIPDDEFAESLRNRDYGGLMGHFTVNMGQIKDDDVLLHSRNAYFTSSGVIFRTVESEKPGTFKSPGALSQETGLSTHVYKMEFVDADDVEPVGGDLLDHKNNFFLGSDPSAWVVDVPNYREVNYKNLYEKIDLTFRHSLGGMKYEFVVHPGGDVEKIRLRYIGASLASSGRELFIHTPIGTVVDGGLFVYQEVEGERVPVSAQIQVEGNYVHYNVEYDTRYKLVIDPLIYSTFIGGATNLLGDYAESVVVDSVGNAYIVGVTTNPDFPTTPGSFNETVSGSYDNFILKLNTKGNNLLYSTFIGGSSIDNGNDIVLDPFGNVIITGQTFSNDFPTTPGAFCSTASSMVDAFISKLNFAGNALIYSTYIGGDDNDEGHAVALDNSNNAIVVGETRSVDFPTTPDAYNLTYNGTTDIFFLKVNETGYVNYSTFIGGNQTDTPHSVALDDQNNVYIVGKTNSPNFPVTPNGYSTTLSSTDNDAFALKMNSTGDKLIYSTFIGGGQYDIANDLFLDKTNNAYIAGWTESSDFPTTSGAYDAILNGISDIFVLRLNFDGSDLVYSTLVGGDRADEASSLCVDASNNAYITGVTDSTDFPTTWGTFDPNFNGKAFFGDTFIVKVNPTGTNVTYSSYIGGTDDEIGNGIALDFDNNAYIVGSTNSGNFPVTSGAYSETISGLGWDAFILKFNLSVPPDPPVNINLETSDQYVHLNWSQPSIDGGSPVINYTIYRGGNMVDLKKVAVVEGARSFNDTGRTNGKVFYYAITSSNIAGEGNRSLIVNGKPGAPPTEPLALNGTAGDRIVHLTWSRPGDEKGYSITNYSVFRGPDPDNISLLITIGNELSYNDTGLNNGTSYYYSISAINGRGEGNLSEIVEFIPARRPTRPLNLNGSTGNGYVTLSWEPPAYYGGIDLTGYRIFRRQGFTEVTFNVSKDQLTYNDTTIKNGWEYEYIVAGENMKGTGDRSDPFSMVAGGPPGPPSLSAVSGFGTVYLFWETSNDGGFEIQCFNIYRGNNADRLEFIGNTTNMDYIDPNMNYDGPTYYSVSAVNVRGEGTRSNVVFTQPVEKEPGPAKNLTVEPGDRSVKLSWNPPLDNGGWEITRYNIYKGVSEELLRLYETSDVLQFEDTDVLNGVTYYYAVSAVNEIGEGELTDPVSATPYGPPGKVDLEYEDGDGFVHLIWKAPTETGGYPITGYKVHKGDTQENMTVLTIVTVTNYNDTHMVNGQYYFYMVTALNDVGEGPPSDILKTTPGPVPGAPENLKVRVKGDEVLLRWNPPSSTGDPPITGYIIYKGTSKLDMEPIATVTGQNYTDEDVESGKTYFYKVTSSNIKGESLPTKEKKAVIESEDQMAVDIVTPILGVVLIVMIVVTILVIKKSREGVK